MNQQKVVVKFENCSVADANRWAEDLRRDLLDGVPDMQVDRQRDNPAAQDFGATLVLVLGTPAIVMLAKALKAWLARNNAASIRLETADGILVANNLESKDAAAIVQAFPRK
jgi:hypothetical protein